MIKSYDRPPDRLLSKQETRHKLQQLADVMVKTNYPEAHRVRRKLAADTLTREMTKNLRGGQMLVRYKPATRLDALKARLPRVLRVKFPATYTEY